MLAYDYPLLGLFWTMVFWFFWLAVLLLVFRVVVDILRSRDLAGWAKALWLFFVIFLPLFGAWVYVIVRGGGMGRRDEVSARR